jgi:hypothetical protein
MTRRNCRDKGCNCGGNQRGGDCGCSSNRQTGGRVVNPSEYYGVDSGRYSESNTTTPYASYQLVERTNAMNALDSAMKPSMVGGSRRRSRRSRRTKRKAPKYSSRYSNRSKYLIHSRPKKSRKSSK